jgi:uncharacterized protein with HEPN domain
VSRDLLLFLEDIEKSCSKIVLYTSGQTRDEVFADEMRFDAILRNLHIIGEAVKNLPQEWRQKHPDVQWRALAGMRDFVAHVYFALDLEILWSAIKDEVPGLLQRIQEILREEREAQGS